MKVWMKEERNEGTKKRANVYKCSSMLQWHVFDILVTRPFRFSNGNMRSRSPISNYVLIMLSLSQDIDFPRFGLSFFLCRDKLYKHL